jgi:hypothetical protein
VSSESGEPVEHRHQEIGARRRAVRMTSGRRSVDRDPRTTFTKKFLVVVVALLNAVYWVSELLLFGPNGCH